MDIKKEKKLFDFFRINHDLLLTSYEIDEIIKNVENNEDDISKKINYKINMYRFVNIVIVMLILLFFNKSIIRYGLLVYFLLNIAILLYSIYQQKKKWK